MHPVSIHIVDDDRDIREGLAWLFDSRGYRAATWENGKVFLDEAAHSWTSAWNRCRA
jgi:two-component system, LuxR family, response regulator DctR